jgi:heparan-alpha-glucosaminide N-acetyltransferase
MLLKPPNMNRIQSIDIFRGFTIFMMVFVNDVAGVADIPTWMKHVSKDADAMTFVDVVFPAFLFIVGMSIPLAIRAREAKGESILEIIGHIALRTGSLLFLGVFMVNAEQMNEEATLLPARLWNLLLYGSAILIWNQYPKNKGNQQIWTGLRILGLLVLGVLWYAFRKGEPDALMGMTTSWWGILGLIGWAYFLTAIVYMLFRENTTAIVAVCALFIATAMGLKAKNLELPAMFLWLKGQSGHFIHASLALAGMSLACLFTGQSTAETPNNRMKWIIAGGILSLLAAYFLRPFYGISKIYATPAWALNSVAICCGVFLLIYWLADVKNINRWAKFLEPAGKNPLLTYILPNIFYALVGYTWIPVALKSGGFGILKSLVFTLFILWIAAFLTKWRVRLQL